LQTAAKLQCTDLFQNVEMFSENNLTHFLYKYNITSFAMKTNVGFFPNLAEVTE